MHLSNVCSRERGCWVDVMHLALVDSTIPKLRPVADVIGRDVVRETASAKEIWLMSQVEVVARIDAV